MSPSDALTPNLLSDWLDYLGIKDCSCEWAWRGMGVLWGRLGNGWVRVDTACDCPHHASRDTATIPKRQESDV